MRFASSFTLLGLCISQALAQTTTKPKCNAQDNCARQITGTFRGLPTKSARLDDCASFQRCTAEPTGLSSTTYCPTAIPTYASSCDAIARYESACACAGFPKTTTTLTRLEPTPLTTFAIILQPTPGTVVPVTLAKNTAESELVNGGDFFVHGSPVLYAKASRTVPTFKLKDEQLLTSDGKKGAIVNIFYFDDQEGTFYEQSYIFFDKVENEDTARFDTDPIICEFGAYDISMKGFALDCHTPGIYRQLLLDSQNRLILSSVGPASNTQKRAGKLFAIAAPPTA